MSFVVWTAAGAFEVAQAAVRGTLHVRNVVLTFESSTIAYYLNGRLSRVHAPAFARPDVKDVPMWIGRSQGLGKPYFKGSMDQVRIYDRAISAEHVLARYRKDAFAFGRDVSVLARPEVRIDVLPEPGWIVAQADYGLMRPLPTDCSVTWTMSLPLPSTWNSSLYVYVVLSVPSLVTTPSWISTPIRSSRGRCARVESAT